MKLWRSGGAVVGVAIGLLSLANLGAAPGGDSLQVSGDAIAQPHQWTVADLKQQFASQLSNITYQSHSGAHTSACVPLLAVLKAAGVGTELKMDPKADPHTKHAPLRVAIVAEASDGYAVVFSLAELLPEIGNRPVWVALDQDGQPLADHDGPVKLVVPDDTKPARWIHAVDRLELITLPVSSPATQPS